MAPKNESYEINQHIHKRNSSSHDVFSQRYRSYHSSVIYTSFQFSYNDSYSQNRLAPPSYIYNHHGQDSLSFCGGFPSCVPSISSQCKP